jgi:hypothetical protein
VPEIFAAFMTTADGAVERRHHRVRHPPCQRRHQLRRKHKSHQCRPRRRLYPVQPLAARNYDIPNPYTLVICTQTEAVVLNGLQCSRRDTAGSGDIVNAVNAPGRILATERQASTAIQRLQYPSSSPRFMAEPSERTLAFPPRSVTAPVNSDVPTATVSANNNARHPVDFGSFPPPRRMTGGYVFASLRRRRNRETACFARLQLLQRRSADRHLVSPTLKVGAVLKVVAAVARAQVGPVWNAAPVAM